MSWSEFAARYQATEAALQRYVEGLPLWVNVWRGWMFLVFGLSIVFVIRRVEARWVAATMVVSIAAYNLVSMASGVGRFPSIAFLVFWFPLAVYLYRRRGCLPRASRFDRVYATWLTLALGEARDLARLRQLQRVVLPGARGPVMGQGSPERFSTDRLVFSRPCAADLDELVRMHADPEVMATLGGVRSPAQTEEYLAQLVAHWEQHGFGLWVLREPSTGRFAGRGGLRRVAIGGGDEVEVAYSLTAGFWGRGLATEVARESIRVAFDALGLPDLVCFTSVTNRASRRVMEKAGFHYERDLVHVGSPCVFYRLTAPAWRAAAGDLA